MLLNQKRKQKVRNLEGNTDQNSFFLRHPLKKENRILLLSS
jgi:hypothetical protein